MLDIDTICLFAQDEAGDGAVAYFCGTLVPCLKLFQNLINGYNTNFIGLGFCYETRQRLWLLQNVLV